MVFLHVALIISPLLIGNCSGDFEFNITMFFEAYVRQWLVNMDNKTKIWVEAVSVHTLMWFLKLMIEYLFSRPLLKTRY